MCTAFLYDSWYTVSFANDVQNGANCIMQPGAFSSLIFPSISDFLQHTSLTSEEVIALETFSHYSRVGVYKDGAVYFLYFLKYFGLKEVLFKTQLLIIFTFHKSY